MSDKWRTREELAHKVALLAKQGTTRRAIARALGVSRNTVRALLDAHQAGRETEHIAVERRPSRAPRAQKLDPYKPRIAELIARFPDITAQRVFETLRDEGFDGGYTGIKKYVRSVRPPKKPAPSLTTPNYVSGVAKIDGRKGTNFDGAANWSEPRL